MKKYLLLLFSFFIVSCGTDYMLSSFYMRKDLQWLASPSQQASIDSKYQISGNATFQNTSPSIIVTPANYILSIYEHRYTDDPNIIGVTGNNVVDVYVSTSLDAANFVSFDKVVGNSSIGSFDSHGSPIGFVDRNGNVVVLAVSGVGFAQGTDPNKLTPISITISKDNGQSWTKWEDIDSNVFKSLADKGFNRYYTNPGNGKKLRNGTLACIIDYRDSTKGDKNKPEGFAIFYSTNDGKDWQIGATMSYTSYTHRFARIIAENSDGSLLIAAVPNTGDNYNTQENLQWFKASSINGIISSFTATGLPKNNGGTISGDNCTFTYNGSKKNGIILAHSFPGRMYTNPNDVSYPVENCTAISISEDEGTSWKLITNIVGTGPQDVASFRQSLMVLKDGTIATCYEESTGASISSSLKFYIVYRRFSLESISKGIYKYEGF